MDKKISKQDKRLKGELEIPSDKSISHRAVIISTLTKGHYVIKNFSDGQDPYSSLKICKKLGIITEYKNDGELHITSAGELKKPSTDLNCGNSGTTMRLMAAIMAGQKFNSTLSGDSSLSARPMQRIIAPLSLMGAKIKSNKGTAPLEICGNKLHGIKYNTPIASAQVKSSILLAGLMADGETTVIEPYLSRNHTELLLSYMNANIKSEGLCTTVTKCELTPKEIEICGDFSSAAYFIGAALIVPNSKIILRNVGLNPTRTGLLEVLQKMGADIKILDKRTVSNELTGDMLISYSELKSSTIEKSIIPRMIDEIPILAIIATQASGQTIIKDAADLRNKESDRIKSVVTELKKLGASIEETSDGMVINGKTNLKGGVEVETYHDHRLAMCLYVAGLICQKEILIKDFEWVKISFPEFESLFSSLLI